jgi:hypothetical protein
MGHTDKTIYFLMFGLMSSGGTNFDSKKAKKITIGGGTTVGRAHRF